MLNGTRPEENILSNCSTNNGWRSFGLHEHRKLSTWLMNQARRTDQGIALVVLLIDEIRHRRIMVPVFSVLERLTIAARALAYRVMSSAAWHIRKETYTKALAEVVNYHHRIGFYWDLG